MKIMLENSAPNHVLTEIIYLAQNVFVNLAMVALGVMYFVEV